MSFIPTQSTLSIGGRVFTDLANLIYLYASAEANQYGTMRTQAGPAGYAVTSGKTLIIYAVRINILIADPASKIYIGYGDDDVGLSTPTAPTTPKFLANVGQQASVILTTPAVGLTETVLNFNVPATKYPFIVTAGSVSIQTLALGYEV